MFGPNSGDLCYFAADATVPTIYTESLAAVDPSFSGETSLSSLSRVLNTSGLPASTIDRVRSAFPHRQLLEPMQGI